MRRSGPVSAPRPLLCVSKQLQQHSLYGLFPKGAAIRKSGSFSHFSSFDWLLLLFIVTIRSGSTLPNTQPLFSSYVFISKAGDKNSHKRLQHHHQSASPPSTTQPSLINHILPLGIINSLSPSLSISGPKYSSIIVTSRL